MRLDLPTFINIDLETNQLVSNIIISLLSILLLTPLPILAECLIFRRCRNGILGRNRLKIKRHKILCTESR